MPQGDNTTKSVRLGPYKWKKGQPSPNPKGRGKDAELSALRMAAHELFMPHASQARETIVHIMEHGEKEANRLKAAEIVIERTYGKAPQEVEWRKAEDMSDEELLAEAARIVAGK